MVENPSESGDGKKPPRSSARPASSARKPPPARRPAAKRTTTAKSDSTGAKTDSTRATPATGKSTTTRTSAARRPAAKTSRTASPKPPVDEAPQTEAVESPVEPEQIENAPVEVAPEAIEDAPEPEPEPEPAAAAAEPETETAAAEPEPEPEAEDAAAEPEPAPEPAEIETAAAEAEAAETEPESEAAEPEDATEAIDDGAGEELAPGEEREPIDESDDAADELPAAVEESAEPTDDEPTDLDADDEIDEETRERPAIPQPVDEETRERPADEHSDEIDEETRERPRPQPTGDAEPPVVDGGSATSALTGLAAWSKRVATTTGTRIGTLSRRTATVIREQAAAAAERAAANRAAAQERAVAARIEQEERAETARLEREQRAVELEIAELEARAAVPAAVEEPLEFEIIPAVDPAEFVLAVSGLTKRFDDKLAVDRVSLRVHPGAFYGIVGPNGAGKTTTLSMITGLLRPDAGTVVVHGSDVWANPAAAKRNMGVLPDRLRLFDRLTGNQLLFYAGVLRGLDAATVRRRTADLARAFGLDEALPRLVSDYSSGMTKKIALAAAMIHSPRLLVLDEPFESVDPVSAATVTQILKQYVAAGGTVLLSSHSMDLVQRICDHVAVVVNGVILADGTMDEVRAGSSLEERFVELAGGRTSVEGLEWLHSFSD